MMLKRLRETTFTALVVVCAMGMLIAGCGKSDEKDTVVVDYSDPAVRGQDKEYQALLTKRNEVQKAIAIKRAPLIERMHALAVENGNDEAKLSAIAEWNDLKEQVTKLNDEYEAERKKTMALIRQQIMTKKTISK